MKTTILILCLILMLPLTCLAEAGDHERAELAKQYQEVFNKAYPKTIQMGTNTMKRYKNSTSYYNRTLYPTGAPKYFKQAVDHRRYKRQLRQIRHRMRRCN